MTKVDEKYVEVLKEVLQQQKTWERNDLLVAFRKKLKVTKKVKSSKYQKSAIVSMSVSDARRGGKHLKVWFRFRFNSPIEVYVTSDEFKPVRDNFDAMMDLAVTKLQARGKKKTNE
jgi:hypothetical protein